MSETPKDRITIEPEYDRNRDETREIANADQTSEIVDILVKEYGNNPGISFRIHREFYLNMIITDEAKQLIIDALKKHPEIMITSKVIKDLPEIIIRYMGRVGYDINKVRERILVLSTKFREKE